MTNNKSTFLPQVEYYYDGHIYPFIGNADLKTLVRWRLEKLQSDAIYHYNKDARATYFEHLACIEQCIRILFSNPSPEFAINALRKRHERLADEALQTSQYHQELLNKIIAKYHQQ